MEKEKNGEVRKFLLKKFYYHISLMPLQLRHPLKGEGGGKLGGRVSQGENETF